MAAASEGTTIGQMPVSFFDLACWQMAGEAVALVAGHHGSADSLLFVRVQPDCSRQAAGHVGGGPLSRARLVFAGLWAERSRAMQACASDGHRWCALAHRDSCWALEIRTEQEWLAVEHTVLLEHPDNDEDVRDPHVVLAHCWREIRHQDRLTRSAAEAAWSQQLQPLQPAMATIARLLMEGETVIGPTVALALRDQPR